MMLRILPLRLSRDTLLLFAPLALLPWLAMLVAMLAAYHQQLRPEQVQRLQTVGRSVTEPVERALALGIPFRELREMDAFMDSVMKEKPFLRSLALVPGPELGDAPEFRRGTGPEGLEVTVPVRLAGNQVASLRVTEKAGTQEPGYQFALRTMLVALLVVLIAGAQIARALLDVLVTEPLLLAERVVEDVTLGRFAHLAAGAATGGELGALLAAANRLLRRSADRTEDVMIYGQEVRAIVVEPAAQGSIDALLTDLGGRIRLERPLRELAPQQNGPLHRLAAVFTVIALVLQLPALGPLSGLWSVETGFGRGTGTASVMLIILAAVLLPGRPCAALGRLLGRRAALTAAVALALLPTLLAWLLPPGVLMGQGPMLSVLLPLGAVPLTVVPLCAVLGLAGLLRQGVGSPHRHRVIHASAIGMTLPGVACGCGTLYLIPEPIMASGLAGGLALLSFVLLQAAPGDGRNPSRPDRPAAGLLQLASSLAGAPAMAAILLGFVALGGVLAAALPDRLDGVAATVWASVAVYAAAAMLGSALGSAITVSSPSRGGLAAIGTGLPPMLGWSLLAVLSIVVSNDAPMLAVAGMVIGAVATLAQGALNRTAPAVPRTNQRLAGRILGVTGAGIGLLAGALLPGDTALIWLGGGATALSAAFAVLARSMPLPKAPNARP